jgi:hypothetical protein
MKIEEFYKLYKNLLFSILCFFSGTYALINEENRNFYGWFILAISFLFLSTFFEQKNMNRKQRKVKVLIISSYTVAIVLILLGLSKLVE